MPAEEAWEFAAAIPAGTPKAAPVTVLTRFPDRRVHEIRWTVPPGPSGLAGWRITMGGIQVVPASLGTWIVRDGHYASTALGGLPTSGAWDVTGYNTGRFPHTLYVTFLVEVITPAPVLPVPLGLAELSSGFDALPARQVRPALPCLSIQPAR